MRISRRERAYGEGETRKTGAYINIAYTVGQKVSEFRE
jgi:hypothetical protein